MGCYKNSNLPWGAKTSIFLNKQAEISLQRWISLHGVVSILRMFPYLTETMQCKTHFS